MSGLDEHGLIARYFRPLADDPAAFDLLDDAAVLSPRPGYDLVLTKDGIAEGRHFLPGESGDVVAKRALRVNLSDLAAMGADPVGYLVMLALPPGWTEAWVSAFATGLAEDQAGYRLGLLGGDTIRASGLVVSVTAIGSVESGRAVRRNGARPGDLVYVSGTIGDGALGLKAALGQGLPSSLPAQCRDALERRYRLPQPRMELASAVRRYASAALDVSDGLAGDLDKLCAASACSALIDVARVPLSDAARAAVSEDPSLLDDCLGGGDDYELLCTVPPRDAADFEATTGAVGTAVTVIGEIVAAKGPSVFRDGSGERRFSRRSFSHIG